MTFTQPPRAHRRTDRLRRAAQLIGLRATFRTLDLVAPSVAARRALAVWCTLPSNAGRRKDFRAAAGETVRLPVPRGGEVVAETWGQGPVVYLVHGWGGWRGQLGAFVGPLVEAGHRVVAFDTPSHGDSDPGAMGAGRGNLMEFLEAFEVVTDHFGEAEGVVAHSMGCTSSSVAIRAGVPVRRLVLIAPNHDFADITRDFSRLLGFTERTRSRLQQLMEVFCERPLTDFDLAPLGADGAMPPTLVVHDLRDKETPFQVGADLAAAWTGAELVTTDGLGHQRILTDAATIARTVGHLTGQVAHRSGR
ncbi:alpha/beta fold hydrolase [Actinotalea sp. K2]|uniref:alpha/beta fold hydrolase n=1 Tax=Actinotalea sp. K2 TaxID=2939438 RepID=UPI0020173E0C|nr:alpha/beta fold hydrolase [Actinotalea sp. K2]MCL3859529.1 alpha/beta hydrolase [Actinotalea sp. K2]